MRYLIVSLMGSLISSLYGQSDSLVMRAAPLRQAPPVQNETIQRTAPTNQPHSEMLYEKAAPALPAPRRQTHNMPSEKTTRPEETSNPNQP